MREFPPAFAARLAAGVSTFATCWRVARRDGVVLGFTDHDRALAFDGADFEPDAGADGAAISASAGFAVDNSAVEGALSSERLSPEDLTSGRFDGAVVEVWRVDWTDVSIRALMKRATVGEVRREGGRFSAELRGPAAALERVFGRVYQKGCDAAFADARCGLDAADPRWFRDGVVVAVLGETRFRAGGLAGAGAQAFAAGRLDWTSGANAATASTVFSSSEDEIALAAPPGRPLAAGDAFRVLAGCDKSFATCRGRFANAARFRGFPFMPGDDAAVSYPLRGEIHDGGRRT